MFVDLYFILNVINIQIHCSIVLRFVLFIFFPYYEKHEKVYLKELNYYSLSLIILNGDLISILFVNLFNGNFSFEVLKSLNS